MREYRDENIPLAYLITFRAYGTWLHGDRRGSVDRFHNRFGTSLIAPNERWRKYNHSLLAHSPVKLRSRQRALVEEAIRETCKIRKWEFWTTNVRTNHIHTVVSADCDPEKILIAFKANATRKLREAGFWRSSRSPWVDRGSKRYLWTENDVINAVVYVEYDQGEPLCQFNCCRCVLHWSQPLATAHRGSTNTKPGVATGSVTIKNELVVTGPGLYLFSAAASLPLKTMPAKAA